MRGDEKTRNGHDQREDAAQRAASAVENDFCDKMGTDSSKATKSRDEAVQMILQSSAMYAHAVCMALSMSLTLATQTEASNTACANKKPKFQLGNH